MKRLRNIKLAIILGALALVLTACGSNQDQASEEPEQIQVEEQETTESEAPEETETEEETEEAEETESSESGTVTVTDIHGEVEVPVNPETVVSLDNRTFETLDDWGVELAAAPQPLIPSSISYSTDESVVNIGNHKEPDLEAIAAVDPDLVIIGQRFTSFEEDIRELVPQAAVINLNFDVSDETDQQAENFVNGFKESTETLGKIFEKEDEAETLISDFEDAIDEVQVAYNPDETIMSVVVSGGEIGFSAPGSGRVWGPMYEIFNWTPALQIDDASSDHKGDDVSVEAIAESNPDWLLVLDRDAAAAEGEDNIPATDVIENSDALANVTAITEGNVVYAPEDTYTNESIQTYIELFNDLASEFSK